MTIDNDHQAKADISTIRLIARGFVRYDQLRTMMVIDMRKAMEGRMILGLLNVCNVILLYAQ